MYERGGIAERGLDRDRLPAARDRAGERYDAFGGRQHRGTLGRADIDAAVLPRGVWVSTVERERAQHRPVDGPRPGVRNGHR